MINTSPVQQTSAGRVDLHDLKEFDGHEFVIALTDTASNMKAFVAVHNRNLGMAHGGTRLKTYEQEEDAIKDALKLSKAMTYKSALAGLPYGGAKGVIVLPEGADRDVILRAYAEKVDLLGGLFHTGTDVGLSDEDVSSMALHCKYMLGVAPVQGSTYSTSKAAAIGVYQAIKAACEQRYGSQNLEGKVIGIKGVGKLGGELAHLLHKDGAVLIISDNNQQSLDALTSSLSGCEIADSQQIHKMKMDVYAPCALGNEFTAENIEALSCDIIAGGANNQLESDEVGDLLHEKGITYVPDYVANAGGLIFVSEELEDGGCSVERLETRLNNIFLTVTRILEEAGESGKPSHRVADRLAQEIVEGARL